jgi:hypothetical protein
MECQRARRKEEELDKTLHENNINSSVIAESKNKL